MFRKKERISLLMLRQTKKEEGIAYNKINECSNYRNFGVIGLLIKQNTTSISKIIAEVWKRDATIMAMIYFKGLLSTIKSVARKKIILLLVDASLRIRQVCGKIKYIYKKQTSNILAEHIF